MALGATGARWRGHGLIVGNVEVAAVFLEMGELLQIAGGDKYRSRAFRRTAQLIEGMREPLVEQIQRGILAKVPGIGPGSVERIKAILATGTCPDHQQLLARLPTGLREILHVRGMGPRHARLAFEMLGVHDLSTLEAAARNGTLAMVPAVGAKTVERVLAHLDDMKKGPPPRLRLDDALALGKRLTEWMKDDPATSMVEQTGSARRRKETVGDLDVLVATRHPAAVVQRFTSFPDVHEVILAGDSRATVILNNGVQCDLRVITAETFGAGLHYFTGSKQHNIQMRTRANDMKLHMSEHGIWERKLYGRGQGDLNRKLARLVTAGRTEEELFRALGLPFIPPELREGDGEIEAAAQGRLPQLVEPGDLQGDLHVTPASIVEASALLHAAKAAGLAYLGIVRECTALEKDDEFVRELRLLEEKLGVRAFLGALAPIGVTGTISLAPRVRRDVDFVCGVVVDERALDAVMQTARVVAAIDSGAIDVLCRPLGRTLLPRSGTPEERALDVDIWAILKAAAKARVVVEVSGDPRHLDLDARGCRSNRDIGAPLSIASNARVPEEFARTTYAIGQARRGWLGKDLFLNSKPLVDVERWFAGRRSERAGPRSSRAARGRLHAARVPAAAAEDPLARALQESPLSAEMLARLQRFLTGAPDEALERTLTRAAGNALQRAFELVAANQR